MRKYRCVFIGAGYVVDKHHLPAYSNMDEVEVVALCDNNESAMNYIGDKYGIEKRYRDADKMLSQEKPDISIICTPPNTHKLFLEKSLQHGCHVLTEKPLALNLTEIDEMIEYASRFSQKVMVSQNYRWLKETIAARKIIDDGQIGEPYWINIANHLWHNKLVLGNVKVESRNYWRTKLHDKEVLFDVGVHLIDLSRYWFKAKAKTVYCQIPKLRHFSAIGGKGMVTLQISFENQKSASLVIDWASVGGPLNYWDRARIACSKGCIEIKYMDSLEAYSKEKDNKLVPDVKEDNAWAGANRRVMEHFLDSINKNKSPLTDLEDNRETMKIVFSAYESAVGDRVVKL